MALSRQLTIFEGPDGSGKTTAAKLYAELTDAHYVHFPALPCVSTGLGRMYVEAMMPALMGYQDVVFDRSWLSEFPYGMAFRDGADRLGAHGNRMLERLAMRCGATVVFCDPGWRQVRENYMSRREIEMLENEDQLKNVYDLYSDRATQLPYTTFDYGLENVEDIIASVQLIAFNKHPLRDATAGNLDGKTILIGEKYAERKNVDAFYQWPFASFSGSGCSRWLTQQLEIAGVPEHELLWINADQDLSIIYKLGDRRVIALGMEAQNALMKHKIAFITVPHPQHHKRFHIDEPYKLLEFL